MKKRVAQYMVSTECPVCHGKRLRREALSVTFAGLDIAEMSRAAARSGWRELLRPYADGHGAAARRSWRRSIRRRRSSRSGSPRISAARLAVLLDLGLGYLSLERSTPTLSPGELQRLRLATQVRSNLFGVVYVLDEPSAGLHPADTEALLRALDRLKAAGNSLFVVEHELDVIRHADWIVDVGPGRRRARRRDALQRSARRARAASRRRRRARYLFGDDALPRAHAARARGLAAARRRHAQQPARPRRRVSARRVHDRHRRVRLGQVEPGEPGAGRAGRRAARPRRRRRTTTRATSSSATAVATLGGRIVERHGGASSGWCASTRSRSAARRARTSRPTPGCSITCASCSPRPRRRAPAATTPGASRSTSPRAAARTARAKAS